MRRIATFLMLVAAAFYGSIPGTREAETRLHKICKHLRLHGEWFRECDELYNLIEDLAEDYDHIFPVAAE